MSALPQTFADIRRSLAMMEGPSEPARAAVIARQAELTKPLGSLGRLEDIVAFLAMWQGAAMPSLAHPRVLVFAGNHGVVAQAISPYPPSVTQAMVGNFATGGAAINQICAAFGLELAVVPLDLDRPTSDFTRDAAMTEAETVDAFARGMAAVAPDTDLLCIGEMGIGNSTSAAAIYLALYGGRPEAWVGRGAGLDDEGVARKAAVIAAATALHKDMLHDPLDVLRCLGGREIAAMAGAILAARLNHVPVLLDGYIVCAAAAVLAACAENALGHCLAAHVSGEAAHRAVLGKLEKKPLLDLNMRLGEGSGAALAFGLVKAALACHAGMATFAEAQVAGKLES